MDQPVVAGWAFAWTPVRCRALGRSRLGTRGAVLEMLKSEDYFDGFDDFLFVKCRRLRILEADMPADDSVTNPSSRVPSALSASSATRPLPRWPGRALDQPRLAQLARCRMGR
jgi:hypothetical protein